MTLYAVAFFPESGGYEIIPDLIFSDPKQAEWSARQRAFLTGMDEGELDTYYVVPVES